MCDLIKMQTLFKLACLAAVGEAIQKTRRPEGHQSWYKDHKGDIKLKLTSENEFRIMQLTDLHFGEDVKRDEDTILMIKDLIRKEEPDFLAITGDLVSGQMYNF